MLSEYEITNFKPFAGPDKIPIRPITLLFGPNSSGKSSVLQLLLLLKQTIEEAENPETLLLPKGKLVDLGGYRELVHRHDVSKPFSFKLLLDITGREARDSTFDRWSRYLFRYLESRQIGLKVTFGYDDQAANAVLASLDLYIGNQNTPAISYKHEKVKHGKMFRRHQLGAAGGSRLVLRATSETILRVSHADFSHPLWHGLWQRRKQGFLSGRVAEEVNRRLENVKRRLERYQETDTSEQHEEIPRAALSRRTRSKTSLEQELTVLEAQLRRIENYQFEDALKDFEVANSNVALACRNFLPVELRGEIGADFDETYGFIPEYGIPEQVNASAVTVWASMLLRALLDELVYLGPLRDSPERHYIFSGNPSQHVGKTGKMVPDILFKNRELVDKVNEKFETFGVGYTLQVSSVTGDALELHDVYALRLADKYTGVAASILDVGFGISQLLPIIVQSLLAKERTLCIEQPEIHLHPRLQAELGSLLAESIQAPLNNRFIVETHSEHLMMRIQRLIRERKLRSEDVSVVYVERTNEGSKCIPLRLDSEGAFLDPWPGGFFEDAYQEIFR